MFRRLHEPDGQVTLFVDGKPIAASEHDTVAAALLMAGYRAFRRTSTGNSLRGPFCGMGTCFECLVTIDGEPNRQACMTPVRDGQRIETGAAAPDLLDRADQ
jgi:D-hydroxyproline dehydrogenase subunit gamma